MDMTSRVPGWLTPVAWAYIAVSLLSAACIAIAVARLPRASMHPATRVVWVCTALYLGPATLVLYRRYGPPRRRVVQQQQPTALGGLPGGAASALAHLVGVPLVIASGITIAGIDLWVMILTIGVLAIAMLFAYERSVSTTRAGNRATTLGPALGAAVVTVLAFDIGMGGWMLLLHFNAFMPPATDGTFWFLMQLGIVLGLITAYPAVAWLSRRDPS